jgi:AcrR family transcriptional regulator
MEIDHPHAGGQLRAEARRSQILTAASACFREHGFHGASIALISKTAGMSAGHIYHYFENKEAIIAAIVEQDVQHILEINERFRAADDVLEAMLLSVSEGVGRMLERDRAALKVEILAEAARNPRIAELVQAADTTARESFARTLQVLADRGDAAELAATVEVMSALFEGLMVRGIRNPSLDPEVVTRLLRRVIRPLILPA